MKLPLHEFSFVKATAPTKFRRKVIYKQLRQDVAHILSELCKRKGIEIIAAECMPDHVHMFVSIVCQK